MGDVRKSDSKFVDDIPAGFIQSETIIPDVVVTPF